MQLNDFHIFKEIIIKPYNAAQLQPASYDLTLDNIVKLNVQHGWEEYDIEEEKFFLQRGEFILASTIEYVEVPASYSAKVEGKSSLGRQGIATHITAGFIDPGFRGHITLEITNISHQPLLLVKGMRIAQLAAYQLIEPAQRPYGSKELGSHYQDQQQGPVENRSH